MWTGQPCGSRDKLVKHPMHECRGFYTVPCTERTRKGLCGALPAPFVHCTHTSGWWARTDVSVGTIENTLVFLPKETIYLGTQRNTIHFLTCKRTDESISEDRTSVKFFSACGQRGFYPHR